MKKQLMRALSLSMSVALFAATSGTAVAGPGHDGGGHDGKHRWHRVAGMHEGGADRMVRHLTRALDLDEVQRQKIDNIMTAAKPQMDALRERAETNRKAMHELVIDEDYAARLNDLATENGAVATEHALLHGQLKAEIDAVLTPEQRAQWSDEAKEKRDRLRKRTGEHSQTG